MSGKTTLEILKMKGTRKITMVTCYDATFARLVAASGVDMVLVGDSMGMVIQGQETTLPVTVDEIIYHGLAVWRGFNAEAATYGGGTAASADSGAGKAAAARPALPHLTLDMPFMSFQSSPRKALENAGRLMKEGHAESVKLEGATRDTLRGIEKMTASGIPVVGHIGLTPQSVHAMGGFKVQGRDEARAKELLHEAKTLESAGCFAIVLEGMPTPLAAEISLLLGIPTIGIGAGPGCDGQVLVLYDLLGLNPGFSPKFLKRYADLHVDVKRALETYAREVRDGEFPDEAHSFAAAAPAPKAQERRR
ncbi:MAG TPA: 3-methyl-2-oxobutanoate hydroxymethyltransferase [bacterium]|nr:3-methyl-2-oxobutanoate hydroxymethyltransferase [bacterium]